MHSSRLDLAHLQDWVAARRGQVAWRRLAVQAPTVPSAAAALGIGVDQVVKSLIFLVAGRPVLVLANGLRRVDPGRLAEREGVPRNEVRFASSDQALALTGYPVGEMPPFGHREALPTLIDLAVLAQQSVVAGAGDPLVLVEMPLAELLRLALAEQARLTA